MKKLIKRYLEHRKSSEYDTLKMLLKRKYGIYVLYKTIKRFKKKEQIIYYVGSSNINMMRRLAAHANTDQHRGKWDNFSFYQIAQKQYIRDIELFLIRICNPEGNTKKIRKEWKGKYNLAKRLKHNREN